MNIFNINILQKLGVAQAAVTERWPWKEEKTPQNQLPTRRFMKKKVGSYDDKAFHWSIQLS